MRLSRNHLIEQAVAACLLASRMALADQTAQATNPPNQLKEVVVTAELRSENLQNVPITLQAITGKTLQDLNIGTVTDLLKYTPNVTYAGSGPAGGNIFIRGLANQVGFPNVVVYLDDQSGEVSGYNLDVYAADIERVEVLEGPQGTLFGAGAEAGVIRYITNKPKLDTFEFNGALGHAWTTGGDPSNDVQGTINIPLIHDTLAVRLVAYNDKRGGYINNIPATFSRAASDLVSVNYFGGAVPPNAGPISNYAFAGRAINPVTYEGYRAEGLWKVSDDWNVLLTEANQEIDAEGVFWQEAYDGLGKTLPPLSVELFNPDYSIDHFNDTALTVHGRIAMLNLVYAGGYLSRTNDGESDYTNYARGEFSGYYQCNYPGYPFTKNSAGNIVGTPGSAGFCYSPSEYILTNNYFTHQSHELRLSTPDDWRVRGLVGLYYEKWITTQDTNWYYETSPNFVPIGPPAGATVLDPSVRPQGDAYFDDITYGYTQKAAFFSTDIDIVPKKLTLTLGTRWYDMVDFEYGANVGSFGCEIYGPYDGDVPSYPCGLPQSNGTNLNEKNLYKSYVGTRSRVNLAWHVTDEAMLYYTWSQGIRPGGFNRAPPLLSSSSPLYGIWTPSLSYAPDTLTNNEIGWKTRWFNNRLQVNGAIYQENWDNVQIYVFDPQVTGNTSFDANGPNYRVRGTELSVNANIFGGLSVAAAASVNRSTQVTILSLLSNTGQPIAGVNPFGTLGSPLAFAPSFQGNIRVRDDFALGDYQAFWQVGVQHQGGSYASTNTLGTDLQGNSTRYYDPAFTTWNGALGISRDAWSAELYGENLGNSLGILSSGYSLYVKSETIIRPRTYGMRLTYHFESGE